MLDVPLLRKKLSKPLRPFWVTRESNVSQPPQFSDFHPVVLCTASRRVKDGEMSHSGYVQGAGDDSESWAQGLTAPLFWANKSTLMNTVENDMPDLIEELAEKEKNVIGTSKAVQIEPTNWLFATSLDILRSKKFNASDILITCGETSQISLLLSSKPRHLHLECRTGKLGSRDLRQQLVKLLGILSGPRIFSNLYVSCPTGKDLSIGVVLAILCLNTTGDGKTNKPQLQAPLPSTNASLQEILPQNPN
jgi:tRNA A64-2'-O-ribosylphosphate transferase